MPGALDGIRVIDFGQYIAGPLASMLLADQGADVIKVDPPGGPRWKTPANATWNRGKRSIVLDLKREAGLATAQALIQTADVVVENFRPGVMDRLGLGPADMTRANPRLVYCSLPGFASDDPRAGVPAYEGVVGAAAATYLVESGSQESDRPVYTALPIASTFAAFQGVVSIAMALNARERDGTGQYVELPLFDSMFTTNAYRGMSHRDPSNGVTYPYSNGRFGEPQHYGPWNGFYKCKDDRWFYFNGTSNRNWRQVVEAVGITAWDAEGLTDFALLARDPAVAAEAIRRGEHLFKTRTAQEWEDLVAEAGGEGALCRTSEEWTKHPHTRESKMMAQVDDPVYGRMLQPNVNVRMSRTAGKVRGPAPVPDQHREEILAWLASHRAGNGRLAAEATVRAAMDGVRVLDLCIELAGPTLGRTMAEFGADVIKINHPSREEVVVLHNDINQGKRSILLDLQRQEGREVFWRLLERADVVVQNYRAGKMEKLGLGYEDVRQAQAGHHLRFSQSLWARRALGRTPGPRSVRSVGNGHGRPFWRRRGPGATAHPDKRLRHRLHGRIRRGLGPAASEAHRRGPIGGCLPRLYGLDLPVPLHAVVPGQDLGRGSRPGLPGERPPSPRLPGPGRLVIPGRSRV